jgi:hypothetical protein
MLTAASRSLGLRRPSAALCWPVGVPWHDQRLASSGVPVAIEPANVGFDSRQVAGHPAEASIVRVEPVIDAIAAVLRRAAIVHDHATQWLRREGSAVAFRSHPSRPWGGPGPDSGTRKASGTRTTKPRMPHPSSAWVRWRPAIQQTPVIPNPSPPRTISLDTPLTFPYLCLRRPPSRPAQDASRRPRVQLPPCRPSRQLFHISTAS